MLMNRERAALLAITLAALVFAACMGGDGFLPTAGVQFEVEVTDKDTNEPIEGATVVVGDARGETDSSGRETLTVPEGWRVLEVKKSGYRNYETNIMVAEGMGLEEVKLENAPESDTTAEAVELLDEFHGAHTAMEGMFMSHGYALMEHLRPVEGEDLTLMGEYLQELIEHGLMPLGMSIDSMTELANEELESDDGDVPDSGVFRITGTPYEGNVEIDREDRWDNEDDFWDWYLFVEEFGIWVTLTFEGDEHFTDELPDIFSLNYDEIFSIAFQLNEGDWANYEGQELSGRQLGHGSVDLEADEAREEFNLYVHGLLVEHIGAWQTELSADFSLLLEEEKLTLTLEPASLDGPALAGSGAITLRAGSEQWAEEGNNNGSSSRSAPEWICLDLEGSWELFAQDSGAFTTEPLMTLGGTMAVDLQIQNGEEDWPFTGTVEIQGMYGFSQDGDNHAQLEGSLSLELHDVENTSQGGGNSGDGVEVSASLEGTISGSFDGRPIAFDIDLEVPQTDFETVKVQVHSYSYKQDREVRGSVELDFTDEDNAQMQIQLRLYVNEELSLQLDVDADEDSATGKLKDKSDTEIAELVSGVWHFDDGYTYTWWGLF